MFNLQFFRRIILIASFNGYFLCGLDVFGQVNVFHFNHLTTSNGLSDPAIRCITQDKFGFIWISTSNGLNKYNSYDVRIVPLRIKDSVSGVDNFVRALLSDRNGNLWAAFSHGIFRYDFDSGYFVLVKGTNQVTTTKMLQGPGNKAYLNSPDGMLVLQTDKSEISFLKDESESSSKKWMGISVNDFCIGNNNNLFLATDSGLIYYDYLTTKSENKMLPFIHNQAIEKIAIDAEKQVWVSYGDNGSWLLKSDSSLHHGEVFNEFTTNNGLADNRITNLFSDQKGRLWVSTARSGLALFNSSEEHFSMYLHDPLQSNTISSDLTTMVYQDKQGLLWVGTETSGVNFFNPDKRFFHSIQPSYKQFPTLPDVWCRAVGQDKTGNLWLGTASGVSMYNPVKNLYTLFQHTRDETDLLPYNSIRSILCDGDWVWIGTGNGLNRYNRVTRKMQTFREKDSVAISFFWSIIKDHENNIWFGSRDGFYKFNVHTNKMENLSGNAQLAPYMKNNTLSLYEDNRNRIWFGFYSRGLLMYDPVKGQSKYWKKKNNDSLSLTNDHIASITEDKTGVIWVATLDGLNAYDEHADHFTRFNQDRNGIAARTAALLTDRQNRLWFAENKGLGMMDSARKVITHFTKSDGLPTLDFNRQSAFQMDNGEFIYPTLNGFLVFNPDNYAPGAANTDVILSSFKVFEKEFFSSPGLEQKNKISLPYDENFFSLEMTALNYDNPGQNWYAYKLENFDKNWIYSNDRRVNYTNVPGGNYVFHYKTSTRRNEWNSPEKTLDIYISTVYYKTFWFRSLILFVLISGVYTFYRFRLAQRENMLMLQKKTYSLQKEKALVMYENLKQQLNPHFLFNSLSSLGSLISSDPVKAKVFLERMSKIYRYILKSRDNETVPLADEMKLADIYVQLQKTRFKEGLQLELIVPDEYLHRKIAPVTLQNLIENAIKHNIVDASAPLHILISADEEWLCVQNNLQRKVFVETSNKQGLASMESLYYYLTGKRIVITEDQKYFTVKVPLI